MAFSWSEITISPQAIADAEGLGLKGPLMGKLRDMLRYSTPFSHEHGNRRFGPVMLLVKDDVLISVRAIETDPLKDEIARKRKEKLAAKITARSS